MVFHNEMNCDATITLKSSTSSVKKLMTPWQSVACTSEYMLQYVTSHVHLSVCLSVHHRTNLY